VSGDPRQRSGRTLSATDPSIIRDHPSVSEIASPSRSNVRKCFSARYPHAAVKVTRRPRVAGSFAETRLRDRALTNALSTAPARRPKLHPLADRSSRTDTCTRFQSDTRRSRQAEGRARRDTARCPRKARQRCSLCCTPTRAVPTYRRSRAPSSHLGLGKDACPAQCAVARPQPHQHPTRQHPQSPQRSLALTPTWSPLAGGHRRIQNYHQPLRSRHPPRQLHPCGLVPQPTRARVHRRPAARNTRARCASPRLQAIATDCHAAPASRRGSRGCRQRLGLDEPVQAHGRNQGRTTRAKAWPCRQKQRPAQKACQQQPDEQRPE